MNIRPVRSEQDYDASLKRIEELWGSQAGTEEGDELDILLTLVRVYEEGNHPVQYPSPVEAIKFVMDQKGWKQSDLVKYIGSPSKVSEVLSGKRPLTLAMIRALKIGLQIPADVLIQQGSPFPQDGDNVDWGRFPVAEIVKRGWVNGFQPKTQAEEIMRTLAHQAGTDNYFNNHACLRQGTRRSQKDDPFAVQAWLLKVLAEANKIKLITKPSVKTLNPTFLRTMAHFSVLADGPVKAKEYLAAKGIRLVVVPHFKKTYLDGAVLLTDDNIPVVGLTLRYDRLDNFWFTLMHELAHLAHKHVQQTEHKCIIDDLDLMSSLDEMERDADRTANDALIPNHLWEAHSASKTATLADVLDLASQAGVHPAVVAGRVRYTQHNYRILARQVGHGEVRRLFQ